MQRFIITKITPLILLIIVCVPVIIRAQNIGSSDPRDANFQIVPCDGVDKPCTFGHLVETGNRIMNFIVYASVFVLGLGFAINGLRYGVNTTNPQQMTAAGKNLIGMGQGLIFLLVPWIVVKFIAILFLGKNISELFI